MPGLQLLPFLSYQGKTNRDGAVKLLNLLTFFLIEKKIWNDMCCQKRIHNLY